MRELGRLMRADPERFAKVVCVISVLGLTNMVVDAVLKVAGGPVIWGRGSASVMFAILVVLSFAYYRGGAR